MTRSNDKSGQPVEPRPSASVMIIRDGDGGLEVLMMRRAKTMGFAAGAVAFPGGGLEPDKDGDPNQGPQQRDMAFRQCALREIEEETGLVLPGPDSLKQFARWITPAFLPVRFDTWFYLAVLPDGQEPQIRSTEMETLFFERPKLVMSTYKEDVMLPTQANLMGLLDHDLVADAMQNAGDTSATPMEPQIEEIDGVKKLRLPEGLGGALVPIPKFMRRS